MKMFAQFRKRQRTFETLNQRVQSVAKICDFGQLTSNATLFLKFWHFEIARRAITNTGTGMGNLYMMVSSDKHIQCRRDAPLQNCYS